MVSNGRSIKGMLHKRDRRFHGHDMGKARILFAAVAGIGNGVISQQLDLLGNDLHFMAQEFFANGLHFSAAFAADQLVFRQFQKHFLLREAVQHLGLAALLLPLMLTEPGPLGIGKDLIHVLQLPLQFRIFLLKQFNRICQRANQLRYFRGGVCTFFIRCGHSFHP